MTVTINIPLRVLFMDGGAHYLTFAGCNKVFTWLMDNAALQWGWDSGEYVFQVD